jgi:predicted DNA-binding transcriptional regulator AlpA
MEEMERMLEIKDLMRIFNVSRVTIHVWIKNTNFPQPFKIGHKNFWKKSEIEEYIESKRK